MGTTLEGRNRLFVKEGGREGEGVEAHWEGDAGGLRTLIEGPTIVAQEGPVCCPGW